MNRLFGTGATLVVSGGVLFLLNLLSQLMAGQEQRFKFSIMSLAGQERLAWVGDLSSGVLKSSLTTAVSSPFYTLFVVVGLFLVFLSGFKRS